MKKLLAATTAAFAIVPLTQAVSYNLSDDPAVQGSSPMKFANSIVTNVTLNSNTGSYTTGAFSLLADDTSTALVEQIKFDTYCVELNANLTAFDNPYTVIPVGGVDPNSIKIVWNDFFGDSLTTPVKSAAFQLVIWELVYDGGGASFNLTNGSFVVNSDNASGAIAQANTYWTNKGNTPYNLLSQLQDNQRDPNRQDVLWDETNSQGVPEPFTLAFAGLGLAAALRRRSSKK